MNYKESEQILEEIKKANKILLSCHKSPDTDSIGSNLAMYQTLKQLGKDVTVISPDNVHSAYNYLPFIDVIEKVDYPTYDFSKHDLFIVLDASSFDQVAGINDSKIPSIPLITIDHHVTNEKYGFINLLNVVSSASEVLFGVFQDWGIKIDKDIANCLLSGIYADTVSFQTDNTVSSTFRVAAELEDMGADSNNIVLNLFHSIDYSLLKFWSELLKNMQINKELRFVWTAVDYEGFKKYGKPGEAKSLAASLLFRVVKDTDFGIVMVEQKQEVLNMSLRSRTDFDVSKIANELGGSGHKSSAGAWFDFVDFDKAVEKVLEVARKHARQNLEKSSKE